MPHASRRSVVGFAPLFTLLCLSACDSRTAGTETASASSATNPLARPAAIPITSASDEARKLYLDGRALSEQLRAHDARRLYQQAVAKDSSFALAHYQLAINAPTAKEFFEHLKHAVSLADKASEGERLMILALEAGGNAKPAKALEYQQELVAKFPRDERAHFTLGGAYFGRQEYDRAIAEYRAATQINPGFSPAYNLLGYAYRAVERFPDAEQAFKKYIELIPGDPNPYDSYAELLMKTGRFDESIAQYQKALTVDSNFTPSKVGIATNRMLQGRHDEGGALMKRLYAAARDDGDRRTALVTRAIIFVDGGRTDAAVREIDRLATFDAGRGDSANMSGDAQLAGDVLLDAGRADAAAKRYATALALIEASGLSDDVKQDARLAHRYNRARVALAKGDVATAKSEAASYMQGANARQNTFRMQQAHALHGTIALAERQFDAALAHLGEANQQDPQVLYWTALAWKRSGEAAKSKEFAGRAANANILPLVTYAFVRQKAKKLG
ncbi:MAG TPA: tetratricopeptide repeat protein [Gemmatimonadales bacterium]|nr:tetratricopeptide repeat protein [Gemmatimonadales bacterium]